MTISEMIKNSCRKDNTVYEGIVYWDHIKNENTGETLSEVVEKINHIYIEFIQNSRKLTRLQITGEWRRKGLFVTFIDKCKNEIVTAYYTSNDTTDKAWSEDSNWVTLITEKDMKEYVKSFHDWYLVDSSLKATGDQNSSHWWFRNIDGFNSYKKAGKLNADAIIFVQDKGWIYAQGCWYGDKNAGIEDSTIIEQVEANSKDIKELQESISDFDDKIESQQKYTDEKVKDVVKQAYDTMDEQVVSGLKAKADRNSKSQSITTGTLNAEKSITSKKYYFTNETNQQSDGVTKGYAYYDNAEGSFIFGDQSNNVHVKLPVNEIIEEQTVAYKSDIDTSINKLSNTMTTTINNILPTVDESKENIIFKKLTEENE